MAVWPSGLRRLTRNQFRSRAHVRIMQPSLYSFFIFFFLILNVFHRRTAISKKYNSSSHLGQKKPSFKAQLIQ
ncbi:hypothetical protein ACN38_g3389 [Penicillium nordicum]|uniref:Uncharacterized protein n=1 Tax=Penicillium nordicum TaxID=229535 RepID=A0A0M8P5P0_9EURO|nr:hypothetical protein ACN38_g3389 [Penicillium nordicum]